MAPALTLSALLIEIALGYPDRLYRAIGHPVTWMGALISVLDRGLNRPATSDAWRRAAGFLAVLILLATVGAIALAIELTFASLPYGLPATAVLASSLLAQRSLHQHVTPVAAALEQADLAGARKAVSRIVGRDTAALDEAGIARAAIESLAENFSDGVVAPAMWMAAGGLTGAVLYKAINTADSMIGHRTPRHLAFGFAAARLDDLVNLPASRLAALLIVAAAYFTADASPANAWRAMRRDASRHRSPNAGYPEAAMAGALGLMLAGPRSYAGHMVDDAMMGDGRRYATAADIRAALKLYRCADLILIALTALLALGAIWRG
jgi:adenosylcobinamide-phosphate synthase